MDLGAAIGVPDPAESPTGADIGADHTRSGHVGTELPHLRLQTRPVEHHCRDAGRRIGLALLLRGLGLRVCGLRRNRIVGLGDHHRVRPSARLGLCTPGEQVGHRGSQGECQYECGAGEKAGDLGVPTTRCHSLFVAASVSPPGPQDTPRGDRMIWRQGGRWSCQR